MELAKADWQTNGDRISVHMPFQKINEERREVSGFATLDNVDRQGDIVTADASREAFSNFFGNIREMHQPVAVGRMVKFEERQFFDQQDGKSYKGIFVTARISRGAQSTWEKVLDRTLTGFSISGKILDFEPGFTKGANGSRGKSIRIVKRYGMDELSLVDVPANQYSNFFSIHKSADGLVADGLLTETTIKNIFYCRDDGLAPVLEAEKADCPLCKTAMENIGWVEDGPDSDSQIAQVVQKFVQENDFVDKGEGRENMTETMSKSDETAAAVDEVTPESGETAVAEPVDEAAAGDFDFAKAFDDLKSKVESATDEAKTAAEAAVTKAESVTTDAVSKIEGHVADLKKSLDALDVAVNKRIEEISDTLGRIDSKADSVSKRLAKFEEGTAIRKSGDLESSEPSIEKGAGDSTWRGAFLTD